MAAQNLAVASKVIISHKLMCGGMGPMGCKVPNPNKQNQNTENGWGCADGGYGGCGNDGSGKGGGGGEGGDWICDCGFKNRGPNEI